MAVGAGRQPLRDGRAEVLDLVREDAVDRDDVGAVADQLIGAVNGDVGVGIGAEPRHAAGFEVGVEQQRADLRRLPRPVPFIGDAGVRHRRG